MLLALNINATSLLCAWMYRENGGHIQQYVKTVHNVMRNVLRNAFLKEIETSHFPCTHKYGSNI